LEADIEMERKKFKATIKKLEDDQETLVKNSSDLEVESLRLKKTLKDLKDKHKMEISKIEDEWKQSLGDMDSKIKSEETRWEQSTTNQALKVFFLALKIVENY
jgi:hypothetical protein